MRALVQALQATFAEDADVIGILDALWLAQWISPLDSTPQVKGLTLSGALPNIDTQPAVEAGNLQRTGEIPPEIEPPQLTEPVGTVFVGKGGAAADEPFVPVQPVRIAAGLALPQALELVRSFRALPRRVDSRTAIELDEEATVEAIAQNRMQIVPVTHPRKERWFEAVLVVEHAPSMEIWGATVTELERVLKFVGCFRDVRTYWLHTAPQARLFQQSGVEARVDALRDPLGRRIVFLFSTGVSQAWIDGSMGQVIERWTPSIPVVLMHALPKKLWKTTNLGEPPALTNNRTPGGPNVELKTQRGWWARRRTFEGPRQVLPVFALDRDSIEEWGNMIAARRGATAPAFLVRTTKAISATSADNRELSKADRLSQFRGTASAEAYRLAVHLAPGPFTVPIIHLVQNILLGRFAVQSQVAEVMLSGLIERETAITARVPADQVVFRFAKDAQRGLLESLRKDDARRILQDIQTYIDGQIGRPDTQSIWFPKPDGPEKMPATAQPFAVFRDSLIKRLHIDPSVVVKPVVNPEPQPPNPAKADDRSGIVWPLQMPLRAIWILWVDDRPQNNEVEIATLQSFGASIVTATNTSDGLAALSRQVFDLVITDMVRGKNELAGMELLSAIQLGSPAPLAIVYAGTFANSVKNRLRAETAGAYGCTNDAMELFKLVLRASKRVSGRQLELLESLQGQFTALLGQLQSTSEALANFIASQAKLVDDLWDRLVAILDAITDSGCVQVFTGATFLLVAESVAPGVHGDKQGSHSGFVGEAYANVGSVWEPNLRDYENTPAQVTTKSELAIAIVNEEGQSLGVLKIVSRRSHAFTTDQIRWLESFLAAYPLPRKTISVLLLSSHEGQRTAERIREELQSSGIVTRWLSVARISEAENFGSSSAPSPNHRVVVITRDLENNHSLVEQLLSAPPPTYPEDILPVLIGSLNAFEWRERFGAIDDVHDDAAAAKRVLARVQQSQMEPIWQPTLDDARSLAAQGSRARDREDEETAVRYYSKAIALVPRVDFYIGRAAAYWYMHHFEAAIMDYEIALRKSPEWIGHVAFSLGQVLIEAGRYQDGLNYLDQAVISSLTEKAYSQRARGEALAHLGRIDEANESFQDSLAGAPDNAWLYFSLAKLVDSPHALRYYALSLRKRGPKLNRPKLTYALEQVSQLLGLSKTESERCLSSLHGSAEEVFERARESANFGAYEVALFAAEAIRDSETVAMQAILLACRCRRRIGMVEGLDEIVSGLFDSEIVLPEAFVERGYLNLNNRKLREAIDDFSKISSSVEGLCGLGLCAAEEHEVHLARRYFDMANKLAPDNAECKLATARGYSILEDGNPRRLFEQALRATISPLSRWERRSFLNELRDLKGKE